MKTVLLVLLLVSISGCSSVANSQKNLTESQLIRFNKVKTFQDTAIVGVASIAVGSLLLHDLDNSFKFSNEGSFGKDTKYGGMDKLGHAWYGNVISNILYERISSREGQSKSSALQAAGISLGVMALLEVADGFAANTTGFSSGDLVADALGASFSYIRNTNPKIKKLVDFRLEYKPNVSTEEWNIGTFYSDQKYLLAWKLSGVDAIKSSPLRYFEIHTGYYARGFTDYEARKGIDKERSLYVGLGLNLNELFFGRSKGKVSRLKDISSTLFENIQIPHTYGALTDKH